MLLPASRETVHISYADESAARDTTTSPADTNQTAPGLSFGLIEK